MILNKITKFYTRFEKYISGIGLVYGFIFTALTLTRVDEFLENFWIVVNLGLAAGGILALTLYENRLASKKDNSELKNQTIDESVSFHFYLILLIQFAFGGLFSTFFIFYIRSSSLFENWLFLLMLLILLVGNEMWKKHYTRLVFQISVLFVAVYLFFIFLLPVLMHRLGADLFVFSGVLSLAIIALFLFILKKFAQEKFKKSHNLVVISLISIFVIMNILYFTNIIPPIPLSLKNSGIYHEITRLPSGDFSAKADIGTWRDSLTLYPVVYNKPGEALYAFSAVFSPVKFSTQVIHQWQYYNVEKKAWVDSSRIVLPVRGGREAGYRTYSIKNFLTPGRWRVKVLTPTGQVIGRIGFTVKDYSSAVSTETVTL